MKSHVQQQWAQEVHSTILHSDNEKMTVSVRDVVFTNVGGHCVE